MTRITEDDLREFVAKGVVARTMAGAAALAVPGRKPRVREEDATHRAVVQFWQIRYPETWAKTWHTPNGMAARSRKHAAIFSGLGVKPGVFDLVCIARRGPYSGFALELKATDGRESVEQGVWAMQLFQEGWFVAICYSVDKAIAALQEYHAFPPQPFGVQFQLPLPEVP